MNTKSET